MMKTPSCPLMALQQDDHNTDVIFLLQGRVCFSIRQSGCARGWPATQTLLMESRTKKSDGGSMSEGPGLSLLSLRLCPVEQRLSQSAHTSMDMSSERWEKCHNNLWIWEDWRPNCDWIKHHPLNICKHRESDSFNFGEELF